MLPFATLWQKNITTFQIELWGLFYQNKNNFKQKWQPPD
jgi:hypothetical protein